MKRLIATSPAVLGGVAAVTLVAGAGAAIAAWRITSKEVVLTAQTATLSPGNKPNVKAEGSAVTVEWAVNTFGDRNVDSYQIKRYDVSGAEQDPHGGCEKNVVKNECTDTDVPPGSWKYTVVPVKGTWTGPESEKSDAVLVADDGKAVVVQQVPEQGLAGPAAGLKIVETAATPEATAAAEEPAWSLQPGPDGVLGKGDTLTYAGAAPIDPGMIIKGWDGKRRAVSVLATPGETTALLTVKDGETTILGPLAVPAKSVPAEVTFPAKLVAAKGRILLRLGAPQAAPPPAPAPAPKDDTPPPTQPEPPARGEETPGDPTPSESTGEPTETTKTTETTTPADPPAGDETSAPATETTATATPSSAGEVTVLLTET